MKVLIHTYDYVPTTIATSYRMKAFVDAFINNEDEVYVLTRKINNALTNTKEKIIMSYAYNIKKKSNITRFISYLSFGISSFLNSKKIKDIDLVITSTPPQIFNIWGYKIAKRNKAKLLYDVRDIWPDVGVEMGNIKKGGIIYKIFDFLSNYMYNRSNIILTVSEGKVEKLKTKTNKDIWLIENGFDESIMNYSKKSDVIDKYNISRENTCVYIGNVGNAQGLDSLLHCAINTKYKNMQFLIFGKGAQTEHLQREINNKNIRNVKLCGVVNHNDIYSILFNSRMCFVPLKDKTLLDSIPTKTYEALGAGCPVLLVACGDSRKLIDETKLGYYATPGDNKEILEKFDLLLDNYDEIIKNRNIAMNIIVNNYSRQKISSKFVEKIKCKV